MKSRHQPFIPDPPQQPRGYALHLALQVRFMAFILSISLSGMIARSDVGGSSSQRSVIQDST